MHKVDWNDIRYFLAVYRSGSSSGAARELCVQHTTVGRRLAALETDLGARLFTRTPEGLAPTDAAREIAPLAEQAERCFLAIARQISRIDSRIEGKVRLTTSEAFSRYLIPHLARLQARHPGLAVDIDTSNAVLDMARGETDLAVRMAPTKQADLVCRRVGNAGWSLFASPDYIARHGPLSSPDALSGHDVIGFSGVLAETSSGLWLADHAKDARLTMRGHSLVAILNAAAAGIGLALVPCFLAVGETRLRRMTPEVLVARDIYLVFHPDAGRLARIRAVIDFLAQTIGADREVLEGVVSDEVDRVQTSETRVN